MLFKTPHNIDLCGVSVRGQEKHKKMRLQASCLLFRKLDYA